METTIAWSENEKALIRRIRETQRQYDRTAARLAQIGDVYETLARHGDHHKRAALRKMDDNQRSRKRQLINDSTMLITGKHWHELRQAIRQGDQPSVDESAYPDEAIAWFTIAVERGR